MKNGAVYIFGNLNNGNTQYPNDYTKNIFKQFYDRLESNSQIIVHRENSIMYYGYIRKLDTDSQYIGFCIVLNGIALRQLNGLFSIFENAVAMMLESGEILKYDKNGDVISSVSDIVEKRDEVERITKFIINSVSEIEDSAIKLPPVSYKISNTESKNFSINDKLSDIIEASYTYGYTSIIKDKDYNASSVNSAQNVIRGLHEDCSTLLEAYVTIEENYKKLKKQKKQFRNVLILCIVLLICCIGIVIMMSSLHSTKNILSNTQDTLCSTEEVLNTTEQRLGSTEKILNITEQRLGSTEDSLMFAMNSLMLQNEEIEDLEDSVKRLKHRINEVEDLLAKEVEKCKNFEKNFRNDETRNNGLMSITEVEFANVYEEGAIATDYGESIYSNVSMYIQPRIKYKSNESRNVLLTIKVYESSVVKYTMESAVPLKKGYHSVVLKKWGSSQRGAWKKGNYKYEIWLGESCLYTKNLTIY